MSILDVTRVEQDDDWLTAWAVVDHSILTFRANHWGPNEYGPALCKTSILLDGDTDALALEPEALRQLLEQSALEWELVDQGEW